MCLIKKHTKLVIVKQNKYIPGCADNVGFPVGSIVWNEILCSLMNKKIKKPSGYNVKIHKK